MNDNDTIARPAVRCRSVLAVANGKGCIVDYASLLQDAVMMAQLMKIANIAGVSKVRSKGFRTILVDFEGDADATLVLHKIESLLQPTWEQ